MTTYGERNGASVWRGILAGAASGLAATWAMTQFQSGLSALQSRAGGAEQRGQGGAESKQSEPATEKAADLVSRQAGVGPLDAREKETAGQFVHYGFGTLVGAIYGGLAETMPATASGAGVPYGAAVWLMADEVGVPAAGLSSPPTEVPVGSHLSALAAHLVYGLALETSRRVIRRAI